MICRGGVVRDGRVLCHACAVRRRAMGRGRAVRYGRAGHFSATPRMTDTEQ
jgi:hypothetical protein